jgi:hypothetical protein
MIDLAKLPVELTIGTAARYMAARVNPYTVVVGQALASPFHLSPGGRKNVYEAVMSLQMVGTLGNVLEIGFGIDDVVHSMVRSLEGETCLALCATLREAYSCDVAIEVLLELARESKVNGQWMPSYSEWRNLLDVCSGTHSTSQFPLRAEVLMSLGGEDERLGAFKRFGIITKSARGCSSPASIAKALVALLKISRKELNAITIIGYSDTGWLVAVAEWFLGFEVVIKDSHEDILYTSGPNIDTPSVTIIYEHHAARQSNEIQLSGHTYIMEDILELIKQQDTTYHAVFLSGRIP